MTAFQGDRAGRHELRLRLPMVLMVIAATAVPVELRPRDEWALSFDIATPDVVANIIGYLPVGVVLAGLGLRRALLGSLLLSLTCEVSQLVMLQRSPSPVDLTTNVLGAAIGALAARQLGLDLSRIRLRRWMAFPAAVLVAVLTQRAVANAGDRRNPLDDPPGQVALVQWQGDSLAGDRPRSLPPGSSPVGSAADFDGVRNYLDLGDPVPLQLTHSMTISAWVRARAFPPDDAPIVSDAYGFGYQLDLTRDQGPRTIGFKLTDACGSLMARYGATPLTLDTWYHVAGVYDAGTRTLHVYLNGQPDDGVLAGRVTGRQRQSREASRVYIGRRSGSDRFFFAGAIGDVRIYSRALTQDALRAIMRGEDTTAAWATLAHPQDGPAAPRDSLNAGCAGLSEDQDAKIPGLVAACCALLTLIGVTCFGNLPPLVWVAVGAVSGAGLYQAGPSGLPAFNAWVVPLVGAAGAGVVAYSLRRTDPS